MRYLIGLFLAVQLCACSNQQVYDSLKAAQKNECDLLPWAQREECLKQLRPDYREYERERQKIEQKQ